MPYRFTTPDDMQPLDNILNHLGTPALLNARQYIFRIVYTAPETALTAREREVMRIPFTAMMGCPICNSMRLWRDYPGFSDQPIPEEVYENAEKKNIAWEGFTTRERLLLQFIEKFTHHIDELNGDDELWDQLHANFTEQELGDITIMCGNWLGTGHAFKAMGIGSSCEIGDQDTFERLIRKDLDATPAQVAAE